MVAVLVLVVACIGSLIELPRFRAAQQLREMWMYLFLMLFCVGLSIALGLHLNVPNPMDYIKNFYEFLLG